MFIDISKLENRNCLNNFFYDLLKSVNNKIILNHFQKLTNDEIFTKSDKDDYVTLYDKKAEEYLIRKINQKFSYVKVIGEESSFVKNINLLEIDDNQYFTIDPIDGTKNYINKNKNFCTMISLIQKKKPIACFIYYPLFNKYISSFKNFGTKIYDFKKNIKSVLILNNKFINIGTGGTKGIPEPKRNKVLKNFNSNFKRCFIGSAGVETLMLASNEVDFIFHGRVTPWDHSPMDLIIRESGGKVLMFNNKVSFNIFSKGPILATKTISYWELIYSKLNVI